MDDDEIWLNKLTVLVGQYPSLGMLDQGENESVRVWYLLCLQGVANGKELARRHRAGDYPHLRLHGAVDGNDFLPRTARSACPSRMASSPS